MFETTSRREYSIAEVASRFGVSLRILRFYEDRGLLAPRHDSMGRYYDPNDILRLELILKGLALGFTLHEITLLVAPHAATRRAINADDHDIVDGVEDRRLADQLVYLRGKRDAIEAAIDRIDARLDARRRDGD